MPNTQFMARIRWRIFVVDFCILWLFMFSFQSFAYLTNVNLSEGIRLHQIHKDNLYGADHAQYLSDLSVSLFLFRFIGILIGLILSIYVSNRRKIPWIDSLIPFAVVLILGLFNLLGWKQLKQIFLLPGELFDGTLYYLTNGFIMLALGVGLLYLKKSLTSRTTNMEEQLHHA